MDELKILYSPIREPFWKYKGFGLQRYHFFEAKRIRCTCSWRNKSGELAYPDIYEIDSEKAIRMGIPWEKGDLIIIPVKLFDVVKNANSR